MSEIKHVVTHVTGDERDAEVLRAAVKVSDDFGATLEVVFANVPPYVPASIDGILAPQIIEAQGKIYRERAEAARKTLNQLAKGLAAKPVWTEVAGLPVDAVTPRARFADLAVVSQTPLDGVATVTDYDLPAELAMGLGRPVLVIPYVGQYASFGRRAIIGWNASRESARAVADALPFLKRAAEVTVLIANRKAEDAGEADVKAYLKRHGVEAKVALEPATEIDVGDVILSRAADISADLIVMGAYGRSRLREMILGGATHHLLRHMTAPVLLSH